jgi:outer membrane protein assembly factor BamB
MVSALTILCGLLAAGTDTWPAFRGTGDSVSQAEHLPMKWSEGLGVAWKIDLTGYGQSSPIVWRDRVFVTSAEGPNKEQAIVACYALDHGRKLWQQKLVSSQTCPVSDYVSRAAPTPAADEYRVYAFFETGNLAAFTHDGEVVWQRSLVADYGKFLGNHGVGSSLAVTADTVVVLIDHDGPSYLLAVDKATGRTKWKQDRPQKLSWSSPIVAGEQIIVSSSGDCAAFDVRTGKQLWTVDGLSGNTVPSPTVSDKFIVVASSESASNLALRREELSETAEAEIAWRSDEASATFSSALIYRGHVYLVNKAGVAFCLAEDTGKTVWRHRLGGSCWTSPVGACGRVYFFEKSGATTVVAAGPELNVLAENSLTTADRVYGVAVVEGKIVVRMGSQLVCLADPVPGAKPVKQSSSISTEASQESGVPNAAPKFPDLPKAITSFGAATIGKDIYVYGGHHGKAHHYNDAGQSGDLLRLDTAVPKAWETLATGPRLQGLALVAHTGALYRVGGFEARNNETEEQNLWSLADCARYDLAKRAWHDLPPMPSPRSSFDAVVSGDSLIVVGGWSMQGGDKEASWLETAVAYDLRVTDGKWRELPKPPFQRRALSVGALKQNIYAIGGMQPDGKVTRRTSVFDQTAGQWREGPELPGEEMDGFGTACCTLNDRLYVSTSSGKLLRLSADEKSWELVQQLTDARFFHRMVPLAHDRLVLFGGASMQRGKHSSVEAVTMPPQPRVSGTK